MYIYINVNTVTSVTIFYKNSMRIYYMALVINNHYMFSVSINKFEKIYITYSSILLLQITFAVFGNTASNNGY